MFINHQKPNGQLPCFILGGKLPGVEAAEKIGYSQIQECLSFYRLALMVCRMTNDRELLQLCYDSGKKWDSWLRKWRMTENLGLIETFMGFDIGHDNSGMYFGMKCMTNRSIKNGSAVGAEVPPDLDDEAPIFAADMNSNFYATQIALSEMAHMLGIDDEAKHFSSCAKKIKQLIFEYLYNKDDVFFYDADKNKKQRKIMSSAIFHLFLEGVLDPKEDKALIDEIYTKHIKNPDEFWTAVPFPSMSVSDKTFAKHTEYNCWGYFSETLIVLRATLWMDKYGMSRDFDEICKIWLERYTKCFDIIKLGQEFDPLSGEPSKASEWYSSAMLFYIYLARRLGIIKA